MLPVARAEAGMVGTVPGMVWLGEGGKEGCWRGRGERGECPGFRACRCARAGQLIVLEKARSKGVECEEGHTRV